MLSGAEVSLLNRLGLACPPAGLTAAPRWRRCGPLVAVPGERGTRWRERPARPSPAGLAAPRDDDRDLGFPGRRRLGPAARGPPSPAAGAGAMAGAGAGRG